MIPFTLTTNEVFGLVNVLVDVRKKLHKTDDGDRAAYRLDRNLATLGGIVDGVRADLAKRVDEKLNGEQDEAKRSEVFKELATLMGGERQEFSLRTLPVAGLAWAEMDPQLTQPLLRLELVEGELE